MRDPGVDMLSEKSSCQPLSGAVVSNQGEHVSLGLESSVSQRVLSDADHGSPDRGSGRLLGLHSLRSDGSEQMIRRPMT